MSSPFPLCSNESAWLLTPKSALVQAAATTDYGRAPPARARMSLACGPPTSYCIPTRGMQIPTTFCTHWLQAWEFALSSRPAETLRSPVLQENSSPKQGACPQPGPLTIHPSALFSILPAVQPGAGQQVGIQNWEHPPGPWSSVTSIHRQALTQEMPAPAPSTLSCEAQCPKHQEHPKLSTSNGAGEDGTANALPLRGQGSD